jgi:GNAT superfamily N-acetyltransferase
VAIEVLRAQVSDTELIMEMVRRQYGTLNYDRTLYRADALRSGIEARKYRFWIARCDGEAAGIVCLKEHPHFTGTFEGCTLTVLPQFRRHGIAKKLSDTMQSTFENVRAASIFYSILTVRTLEEEREYENGCKPTGYALDRFLFDNGAANLKAESFPARRHHIFLVLPCDKKVTGKLFIPPVLEPFVRRIYADLNIEIGDIPVTPAPTETVYYPENAYIEYYGWRDFENAESTAFAGELPDENTAANLFLDMTDERTPARYDELVSAGWRFTGLKPLQQTAEYIVMHKGGIDSALDASLTLKAFEASKEEIRGISHV